MDFSRIRLIPRLERSEAFVRFAQTWIGRAFLLALAFQAIWFFQTAAIAAQMVGLLAVMTLFPEARRYLLIASGAYVLIVYGQYTRDLVPGSFAGAEVDTLRITRLIGFASVMAMIALHHYTYTRIPISSVQRRPVIWIVTLYMGALAGLSWTTGRYDPFPSYGWTIAAIFGQYLWFYALSFTERNVALPFLVRIGCYQPFWCTWPWATPYPLGERDLQKGESREREDLAVSQIKGVKLLLWAELVSLLLQGLSHACYGGDFYGFSLPAGWILHTPSMDYAFLASDGQGLAWYSYWYILFVSFYLTLLYYIALGHYIIGLARLAGFNLKRNTYKPFYATNVAEFFSRYDYYYKEILVTLFFYPAFFRWFRKHPRVRMFFATFCAAAIGNSLIHLLDGTDRIHDVGLWQAVIDHQSFFVYALLLTLGIYLPQLLGKSGLTGGGRKARSMTVPGKVFASASVFTFFMVINVFFLGTWTIEVGTRFRFLGRMIGL
jgi:hypothetical protein